MLSESENIPPRKIYEAAVLQKVIVHTHVNRVIDRVERFAEDTWERKMQEIDLAKWKAICDILDAICEGKTVQPS